MPSTWRSRRLPGRQIHPVNRLALRLSIFAVLASVAFAIASGMPPSPAAPVAPSKPAATAKSPEPAKPATNTKPATNANSAAAAVPKGAGSNLRGSVPPSPTAPSKQPPSDTPASKESTAQVFKGLNSDTLPPEKRVATDPVPEPVVIYDADAFLGGKKSPPNPATVSPKVPTSLLPRKPGAVTSSNLGGALTGRPRLVTTKISGGGGGGVRSTAASAATCDITVGSWVPSSARPTYGATCPFLSEKYNCVGNGRPDGGFQHLIWQPRDCNMTLFSPLLFSMMFAGKTVALVGDSGAEYLYQSLRCQLAAMVQTADVNATAMGWPGAEAFRVIGFNAVVVFVEVPFLTMATPAVPGLVAINDTWYVPIDSLHPGLLQVVPDAHAIIFSSGQWFAPPNRIYLSKGKPITTPTTGLKAHTFILNTLESYFAFLDKMGKLPNDPRLFFLSMPPAHDPNVFRYQDTSCAVFDSPFLPADQSFAMLRSPASTWTAVERAALAGGSIKLIDVLGMSMYRVDGHVARYGVSQAAQLAEGDFAEPDCGAWCLPGVPDSWVDMFFHYYVHPTGVQQILQNLGVSELSMLCPAGL